MLIQVSVKNFRSFKERATLSLVASNYDKRTRESENVVTDAHFRLRLLKSAVIFGANASGKSNFIQALSFVRTFVRKSSREGQQEQGIPVVPHRLSTLTQEAPSEFELIFLHEGIMYRYGFEVDARQVHAEWLYQKSKTKEVELFYREGAALEVHERRFRKGRLLQKEGLVRDNALLLSVAAQFNDPVASHVMQWFERFKVLWGLHHRGYTAFTVDKTQDSAWRTRILQFLHQADLGIDELEVESRPLREALKDLPGSIKAMLLEKAEEAGTHEIHAVKTRHVVYDKNGRRSKPVYFSMEKDESSGTQQFYALSGPVLDVLENGYTLVVDELDTKLHPNLLQYIVALFHNRLTNPHNAQLIFNGHSTHLMHPEHFRKDQIWFVEKDRYGASTLYALSDFKAQDVRKGEQFEKNYLRGKYQAIPYLEGLEALPAEDAGADKPY